MPHPAELDLTVHYYRPEHLDDTPPLTQNIFDNAAALAMSVTRDVKWYNPADSDGTDFVMGTNCFQWDRDLPKAPGSSGVPSRRTIADWDEDVAVRDDELWALADLEDFDHRHLHHLLELQPPLLAQASEGQFSTDNSLHPINMAVGRKHSLEQDSGALITQATKRPKLDEASLRDVLPEPHFLPSHATIDDPDYQPPSLKLQYSPIPPHTSASANEYMQDEYARLAWIIPVRGRLQWAGATAASILEDDHGPRSPASDDLLPFVDSEPSGSELTWTRDSLNDLWSTLKDLRECGRFGSLSLSFHATVRTGLTYSMEHYSYFGSHKQTTISMSTSVSSDTPADEPQQRNTGLPLSAVDYIKMYHDAKYTKNLRAVLRAWSYRKAGQKLRLLKEAKLVLVDELSRGLVIC